MITHALTLMLLAAEPSVSTHYAPAMDRVVGGAMAPAALSAGTVAFWGMLGAPDIGVGYRQGFSLLEFDAQARFNYLELSTLLDVGARVSIMRRDRLNFAVMAGLGLEFNSGSVYYDRANFASVALRPRVGAVASYLVSDTVQALLTVEAPWAISLNVNGVHIDPKVGAGAEFHLGGRLSVLAMGEIGVDVLKAPLGATQVRPAWALRLGFGYRLF